MCAGYVVCIVPMFLIFLRVSKHNNSIKPVKLCSFHSIFVYEFDERSIMFLDGFIMYVLYSFFMLAVTSMKILNETRKNTHLLKIIFRFSFRFAFASPPKKCMMSPLLILIALCLSLLSLF